MLTAVEETTQAVAAAESLLQQRKVEALMTLKDLTHRELPVCCIFLIIVVFIWMNTGCFL